MPPNNLPEPGEFTRIFKRMHQSPQSGADAESEKKIGEISGIFPAADAAADAAPEQGVAAAPPAAPQPAPSARTPASTPNPPAPEPSEPGEFTQYFVKGLPAKPPQSGNAAPPPTRSVPLGVQRPSTPVPPPRNLATDSSSGTFTERFAPKREAPMHRPDDFGLQNPRMGRAPDLSKPAASDENSAFNLRPPLSKQDAPSEYTKMFGDGSLPPPPKQSAVTPPPPTPMMADSPNHSFPGGGEATMREVPVRPSTPQGPSEYTVISGGRPSVPAGDAAASEAAASRGESAAATRKMNLPKINFNVANPTLPIPGAGGHLPGASANASMAGANVSTPLGGASLNAPRIPPLNAAAGIAAAGAAGAKAPKMSDHTKLILFFGALAILAVILVVVLVATQKS